MRLQEAIYLEANRSSKEKGIRNVLKTEIKKRKRKHRTMEQAFPLFSSSLEIFSRDDSRGPLVLTDLSRFGPSKGQIFKPDTTTQQLIDQFLVMVTQSAMGMDNARILRDHLQSVDFGFFLSRLAFGDELKEFFCADGKETLSGAELRTGFQRMGENFMSRSHEIQNRANSFFLMVIGSSEMQIMNCYTPELAELYEKAQLLLLLSPSMTPAREDSADSKSEATLAGLSVSTVVPDKPVLFRSQTTSAGNHDYHLFFVLSYLLTSTLFQQCSLALARPPSPSQPT